MSVSKSKTECFVIMPVSDTESYPPGHFDRVFEHLIVPACDAAGFSAVLASKIQSTNFIVLDILKRILSADMTVCDLSGRNGNVLYELGLRQAFNRPVTLLKDQRTQRIFDIQGIRDVEYDESLRVDSVKGAINELSETIRNTYDASKRQDGEVNSLVQLLGIQPAKVPQPKQLTDETSLILSALGSLGDRLAELETSAMRVPVPNLGLFAEHPSSVISGTSYIATSPSNLSAPASGLLASVPSSGSPVFVGIPDPNASRYVISTPKTIETVRKPPKKKEDSDGT